MLIKFGKGATHHQEENVERLIELQINGGQIRFTERTPILLQLKNHHGRNWEAIARLDNKGLLLATDKFPSTLFGFIPLEEGL